MVKWTPLEFEIHSICDLLIHINIYEHLLHTYVCMQHTRLLMRMLIMACLVRQQNPAEESQNAHQEEMVNGIMVYPDGGMNTCVI